MLRPVHDPFPPCRFWGRALSAPWFGESGIVVLRPEASCRFSAAPEGFFSGAQNKKPRNALRCPKKVAGEAGLEPARAGSKVPCLTNLATPQFSRQAFLQQ